MQISRGEFALSTLDTIQQLHSQGVCQLSLLGANVAWINVTVNGKSDAQSRISDIWACCRTAVGFWYFP